MNSVNIFFSCDDKYIPFLAVALISMGTNCDSDRQYNIFVLHTGIRKENMERLTRTFSKENFALEFIDISSKVEEISQRLHIRDYYSKSTYYRLFIPELFSNMDKALYLDCDLVIQGDISELYDIDMGSSLVGAVPDGMVGAVEIFQRYVVNRLDITPCKNYFNAGVLLMNLKAMREFCFSEKFINLLGAVTFRVAQDQDYLNVICRDRVTYIRDEWNTMPAGIRTDSPKLIHYNLDSKPWLREGIPYGEIFWEYVERSGFLHEIRMIHDSCTEEDIARAERETENLIILAEQQAQDYDENICIQHKIRGVMNL